MGKLYLTNRCHVAVHLFSNTSPMMSKCPKEQKSGIQGIAEYITDVLNPLTPKISLVILLTVCHTIQVMLVRRIWNWINQ